MYVWPNFIYEPKEMDSQMRAFLPLVSGPFCFLVKWDNEPLRVQYDPRKKHYTFV